MNTSSLLGAMVSETESEGASVQSFDLYSLDFKGCYGCFACKKEHTSSYGICAVKDDLRPVLESIRNCDALFIATPIFYRDVTGAMRSFVERLLFQSMLYSSPPRSLVVKRPKIGLLYTMNILAEQYELSPLKSQIESLESSIRFVLGDVSSFFAFGTNQLGDYDGIEYTYINGRERLERHAEFFPKELVRAREFARQFLK
jgi:hypothetical protein